jgi:DnaK suppressor protein
MKANANKITKSDLAILKKRLQEQQILLRKQIAGDLDTLVTDGSSDDISEGAQDTAFHNVNAGLSENAAEALSNVQDALDRIESPEFGTCDECGKPIALVRLKAIPWVITCLKCQTELESHN